MVACETLRVQAGASDAQHRGSEAEVDMQSPAPLQEQSGE